MRRFMFSFPFCGAKSRSLSWALDHSDHTFYKAAKDDLIGRDVKEAMES